MNFASAAAAGAKSGMAEEMGAKAPLVVTAEDMMKEYEHLQRELALRLEYREDEMRKPARGQRRRGGGGGRGSGRVRPRPAAAWSSKKATPLPSTVAPSFKAAAERVISARPASAPADRRRRAAVLQPAAAWTTLVNQLAPIDALDQLSDTAGASRPSSAKPCAGPTGVAERAMNQRLDSLRSDKVRRAQLYRDVAAAKTRRLNESATTSALHMERRAHALSAATAAEARAEARRSDRRRPQSAAAGRRRRSADVLSPGQRPLSAGVLRPGRLQSFVNHATGADTFFLTDAGMTDDDVCGGGSDGDDIAYDDIAVDYGSSDDESGIAGQHDDAHSMSSRQQAMLIREMLGSVKGNRFAAGNWSQGIKRHIAAAASAENAAKQARASRRRAARLATKREAAAHAHEARSGTIREERIQSEQFVHERTTRWLHATAVAKSVAVLGAAVTAQRARRAHGKLAYRSAHSIISSLRRYVWRCHVWRCNAALEFLSVALGMRVRRWRAWRHSRGAVVLEGWLLNIQLTDLNAAGRFKRLRAMRILVRDLRALRIVLKALRCHVAAMRARRTTLCLQWRAAEEALIRDFIFEAAQVHVDAVIEENKRIGAKNAARRIKNLQPLPPKPIPHLRRADALQATRRASEMVLLPDELKQQVVDANLRRRLAAFYSRTLPEYQANLKRYLHLAARRRRQGGGMGVDDENDAAERALELAELNEEYSPGSPSPPPSPQLLDWRKDPVPPHLAAIFANAALVTPAAIHGIAQVVVSLDRRPVKPVMRWAFDAAGLEAMTNVGARYLRAEAGFYDPRTPLFDEATGARAALPDPRAFGWASASPDGHGADDETERAFSATLRTEIITALAGLVKPQRRASACNLHIVAAPASPASSLPSLQSSSRVSVSDLGSSKSRGGGRAKRP